MTAFRFTLITDGSSDKILLPVLKWLLKTWLPDVSLQERWVDFGSLPNRPITLEGKIVRAIQTYPCDILFIHRDAEREPFQQRVQEIEKAYQQAKIYLPNDSLPYHICVIPVRMSEAWFLFNENAIRQASGNPNGKIKLHLPAIKEIEDMPDPKKELYALLEHSSELTGRKLKNFNPAKQIHRMAENIDDFSPLRALSAFQRLEADVRTWVEL